MMDVYLGIAVFVSIVLLLAVSVLIARAVLMPSKPVTITLNQDKRIAAKTGAKLLSALGDAGISIPSACGIRERRAGDPPCRIGATQRPN
mgnify:CR=1 FL=1